MNGGDLMTFQTIRVERAGHIQTLVLNRPEALNTLTDEMREELYQFFLQAEADPDLRVVVVTGSGRAFSAGIDLNILKKRYETFTREGPQDASHRTRLPRMLLTFSKPVIVAINGIAVGFGATMPLICDIRIASTKARFSFAFAKLGVTPEFCSSFFLPRLIGSANAADLVFRAKMIDADEALRLGLVSEVVPPEELLDKARSIAEEIAQMPAVALQMSKRLLRHGGQSTMQQTFEYESSAFQLSCQTAEHYAAVCRMLDEMKNKKQRPA